MPKRWCYVLFQPAAAAGGRTYAGFTTDPARRLRQHNGELAGGARATSRGRRGGGGGGGGPWAFALLVESAAFDGGDARLALSFEWWLKHRRAEGAGGAPSRLAPAARRGRRAGSGHGLAWRLECLRGALRHPRFAACLPTAAVHCDARLLDDCWAATCDLPGVAVCDLADLALDERA